MKIRRQKGRPCLFRRIKRGIKIGHNKQSATNKKKLYANKDPAIMKCLYFERFPKTDHLALSSKNPDAHEKTTLAIQAATTGGSIPAYPKERQKLLKIQ